MLFLYNVPDWAIHNVGRDWAALVSDTHDVTLKQFGRHEREDPEAYDHVVWGYSSLDYSGRMLVESLTRRPIRWLRWRWGDRSRFRAVIQDPVEMFPTRPDWKSAKPRRSHLRRFRGLAVTSNEMREALALHGIQAVKVNTRSLLPLRDRAQIGIEGLRLFTRALAYPRKNLPLFERLRQRHAAEVERFDASRGHDVMPQVDYARFMDGYNCYVCTSWQEGGPLPLMDALQRGCVVLTTRVGQTDELVEEGGNGFFCSTEEEFDHRIRQLAADPQLLQTMRLRALALAAARDNSRVRSQLRAFLPPRPDAPAEKLGR